MQDLPDHILQRLRDAGISETDIDRLRAQGSIVHDGTNGEQVQVSLDDSGALMMATTDATTWSTDMDSALQNLPPDQAKAARAGVHKAERMMGVDLDGDGVVGPVGAGTDAAGEQGTWDAADANSIHRAATLGDSSHVTRRHAHGRSPVGSPHSMRSGNGGATRLVITVLVVAGIAYGFLHFFA